MADMMAFPETVEEFMNQYKIVDTDGVYMSKGSELVPIFRMRQWFERPVPADVRRILSARWILLRNGDGICSACGFRQMHVWGQDYWQRFCGYCGAEMKGAEKGE